MFCFDILFDVSVLIELELGIGLVGKYGSRNQTSECVKMSLGFICFRCLRVCTMHDLEAPVIWGQSQLLGSEETNASKIVIRAMSVAAGYERAGWCTCGRMIVI